MTTPGLVVDQKRAVAERKTSDAGLANHKTVVAPPNSVLASTLTDGSRQPSMVASGSGAVSTALAQASPPTITGQKQASPPPTTAGRSTGARPSAGSPSSPSEAPVPDEVLLKGDGTFKPSAAVAAYLAKSKPRGGGLVNVRFQGLAAGAIKVNEHGGTYSTPSELQAIELRHPALEPLRKIRIMPMLAVKVQKSKVTGFVTVSNGRKPIDSRHALIGKVKGAEALEALGLLGMSDLQTSKPVNALKDGALTFKTDLEFKLGGFLVGMGSFGFTDDVVTFTASARGRVKGLSDVSLVAERKPDGTIHGRAVSPVKLNDQFSGTLTVILAAGVVEISGTATYSTEKLTGEVSFIVTDAQTARTVAYQHLPPEAIEGSAREAAGAGGAGAAPTPAGPKPGPRAVAGWGTLDVHYNDWLTGQAMVVVDAEGHVTVVGKIALPARHEFPQTKLDYEKRIFGLEVRTVYGIPYVGNVGFFAGVSLDAIARISPLVLSKIEIVGQYSTDPAIHKEFGLSANLNISAVAMLRLRADAGFVTEILEHDIKVGAGIYAMAGVKGYVDTTLRIGHRELADPKAGRRGEFYIHGEAELAAQPFLGLGGELYVKLVTPWWSPISDHTWTWPLGQREYPLAGEFGLGADIDYVLGSNKLPTITPKSPDFNANHFIDAVMDNDVKPGSTGEQQKKGSWKEKLDAPPAAPAPPPKVVDTKGKGTRKRNEPQATREDGKAWAAGMKALDALKARPYTEAELLQALREIKAKHGFSVLQHAIAGDSWEITASRGKDSAKKRLKVKRAVGGVGAPPQAQAPSVPPKTAGKSTGDASKGDPVDRTHFIAQAGVPHVVGALRSVVAPNRIVLSQVAPNVLSEVQQTSQGTALYTRSRGSGPEVVQSIVRERPGARYDDARGVLTLPAVTEAAVAAPSLRGIAQRLGEATGATRVTLARTSQSWGLDVHVNPTLAGLLSHSARNALDPLLAEIRREEVRIHPQRETLIAICREAARRYGATVTFQHDARSGAWEATFDHPGPPPAQHRTTILMLNDNVCAACLANVGRTSPHNVIPRSMWAAATDASLGAFGVVEPYGAWGWDIRSAGTSPRGPAVSEDRQCRACETNQDRPPSPHSLVQRRAGAAAAYVITRAGTPPGAAGEMFVGRQYDPLSAAQAWELTVLKIDQVLQDMRTRLSRPTTGPAGARPNTDLVYVRIVAPGQIDAFVARVRRSILARASAQRSPASFR
jgi:hypothetical protein